MSEADVPKTEQPEAVETNPAEQTPPDQAAAPKRTGNGLAGLALLVGLAGLAGGGWSFWQTQQAPTRQTDDGQRLEGLQQQIDESASQLSQLRQSIDERLAALPGTEALATQRRLLADLQTDQQRTAQQVENILAGGRQNWRLTEAEHLMRLAAVRLSALQDVAGAEALLLTTDTILRDQSDPSAFAAREQLSRALQALRATPRPDRTGLFLQLAAMREQAARSIPLAPSMSPADGDVVAELVADADQSSWWGRWLAALPEYFRIEFDADRSIRPLLSGQSLSEVRLALSLALEQAQWGALHGEETVYLGALKQAGEILDAHFNLDKPDSRGLRQQISDLTNEPVRADMPDLTEALDAVQAYVERKQSQRKQQTQAAGMAGEAP